MHEVASNIYPINKQLKNKKAEIERKKSRQSPQVTHVCFLMNTIQDDELLIWMMDNKNKITVLKVHFGEFDKNFLSQLKNRYSVFFSNKSGKWLRYDYSLIKTEVGL